MFCYEMLLTPATLSTYTAERQQHSAESSCVNCLEFELLK